MRILIVSDAWLPQVNGVVTSLQALVGELVGGRVNGPSKLQTGIGGKICVGVFGIFVLLILQHGEALLDIRLANGNIIGDGIIHATAEVPHFGLLLCKGRG